MGKFSRLAQAAHLLGQAIRHVSDVKTDRAFHDEERLQLDRTLQALAKLSGLESEVKNIIYCGSVAACTRSEIPVTPFLFRRSYKHVECISDDLIL